MRRVNSSSSTARPRSAASSRVSSSGKAVGVVELEGILAGDEVARGDFLEEAQAPLQRLGEALLLGPQDFLDAVPVLLQLRVPLGHLVGDDVGDAPQVGETDPRACCTARRITRRST